MGIRSAVVVGFADANRAVGSARPDAEASSVGHGVETIAGVASRPSGADGFARCLLTVDTNDWLKARHIAVLL